MRRWSATWAAFGMSGAALAQTSSVSAPLEPSGKWTIEYAENMCVLSRDYGRGADAVTIALRTLPLSSVGEIIVISHKPHGIAKEGEGKVAIGTAGVLQPAPYSTYPIKARGIQLTTLSVPIIQKEDLQEAGMIRAAADGWDYRLALRGVKPALAALDACGRDLLRGWGFDPDESSWIATKARGNIASWLQNDDYPPEAIHEGQHGDSIIGWTIGLDGRASDCRVLQTSRVPSLDQAACRAIVRRAKYEPAIGLDGKPMVSHGTTKVSWKLPQ